MSFLLELRPGRLYWRFRQVFGHGLGVAYCRDVLRWRILATPPITGTTDGRCEIHAVTSHRDWINLIWTLKTFYHSSGRNYGLCIHDDGTLTPKQLDTLRTHFPAARVIERPEADRTVAPLLADKPRARAFRGANPLALKVFDTAAFLNADRMLLLDCDLLFFSPPTELLRRIDDPDYRLNTFNRDWANGYSVTPEAVREQVAIELAPRVNSGLGLLHRASLEFGAIERYLGIPGVLDHPWRGEQTLIGICSSHHGYEPLPEDYDVRLGPDDPSLSVRHYTGPIRHLMYSGGMRRLIRSGFLAAVARGRA